MFNTYMGMLVWPMIALGWVVNLMQRGSASLQRINDILRERPSIAAPPDAVRLGAVRGEIEFRGVTVDYGSGPALNGIDLHIPAGATLAVVGHTGSGKSTLVNLLPRLFDPTSGAVMLDGIDLRRADPAELRRQIGFVPQETFLFSATIAGNIAFGVEGATREQIRRAAEMAGLAGDIEGFPLGYDTLVGERGITLSGGQKQRTAIARALLREPRILILDDALSAVDTQTEEQILTHLAGAMHGRTVILISHRVSTVRQADAIVVLERGKIVERGTHEELVEAGGYYAALCQKQMLEEELEAFCRRSSEWSGPFYSGNAQISQIFWGAPGCRARTKRWWRPTDTTRPATARSCEIIACDQARAGNWWRGALRAYLNASACSRSARMSSGASMPTERRTRLSRMPMRWRCFGESSRWGIITG